MQKKEIVNNEQGELSPPSNILKFIERLKQITGFVTVLCTEADKRPLAFSRYFHVRRVVWLANFFTTETNIKNKVNAERVIWLAWTHDLNRWPFSHNSEKGLYDQANDLPRYCKDNNIEISKSNMLDLQGIISKSHAELSIEGKIVLIADIVAGFIEDPLWAITALNLIPEIVPENIASYLCIPLNEPDFIQRLLNLNEIFYNTKTIEPFMTKFDIIFKKIASSFVLKRKLAEDIPLGKVSFEDQRHKIKEELMRGKLFPYNNEKISRGPLIKQNIAIPVYNSLGANANKILTTINEPQMLELAQSRGIIKDNDNISYLPYLDYVVENENDRAFRKNYRE